MCRWQQEILRVRHLPRLLHRTAGRPSGWPHLDAYRSALTQIYREAARATGARVIVDSSKLLPHAAVAASLEEVQPYFIHLIRDPRGVVYSRQSSRAMTMARTGEPYRRLRLARDGWQWMKMNLVTEILRRRVRPGNSLQLRYEDFVGNPRDALRRMLNMLDESPVALPLFENGSIELAGNDTVGGNWIRFRTGPVTTELDTRWLAELDRADRLLSGLVALPLLRRYGYQLDGYALDRSAEAGTTGRTQEVDQGGHR